MTSCPNIKAKDMKPNQSRIAGIAIALFVVSIGGALAYNNFRSAPAKNDLVHLKNTASGFEKLNPNGSELVVRAHVVEANINTRSTAHTFTGTLQPRYLASVGFRVAGKISERLVELGQRIQKGQVLFRLDPADAELQLRVAEADQVSATSMLTQTAAEEKRLIQLRTSNAVSQSDYDLALAGRDVALARLDAANRRLTLAKNQRTYFDLVADSDGLVTSINAEAGQVVNVGQPVLQIMQRDELEAVVSLPEGMVGQVRKLDATALFWSHPGLVLRAELRELSPMADPVSRMYDAKFRVLDSTADLSMGMTASIQLTDETVRGISVPLTSIAVRSSEPIVWRIQTSTGRVEAVPIQVLEYRSDRAVVLGELRTGDQIVSAGIQRIDENALVRVWEKQL